MFKTLLNYLTNHWIFTEQNKYTYGYIVKEDGSKFKARKVNKTKKIEFVLWKAGEHGHDKDFWCSMGSGWENYFISCGSCESYNLEYK